MIHRGFISAVIVSVMVEEKGKQPWTLREFGGKTLWDWLQLLIVPVVLSLITVVFAWQQDTRQDRLENKRAAAEREVAKQRAQDEALQAYLDQMSGLLLERDLRASEVDSEVRTLARVRTLTVLERLDPNRKRAVMQFITEAGLVQGSLKGSLNQKALMSGSTGRKEVSERVPVISLSGADLSGADLSDLGGSGSFYEATSRGTYSYVSGLTNLSGADLTSADLSGANLEEADLSNANLDQANLSNANLEEADLSGTFLRGANLKGATMPSGQKYED